MTNEVTSNFVHVKWHLEEKIFKYILNYKQRKINDQMQDVDNNNCRFQNLGFLVKFPFLLVKTCLHPILTITTLMTYYFE